MNVKTKKYFNVDIEYTSDTYNKGKIIMFIRNKFVPVFISLCVIGLIVLGCFTIKGANTFANRIISTYAVGILDRIFVYSILVVIIAVAIMIAIRVIDLVTDMDLDSVKWTSCCFFLNQKYLKFFWKDNQIFCYHELPDDKGHTSTLEELMSKLYIDFQFHYETEDGKTECISMNELGQIESLTTPLSVKIVLTDSNVVNMYFSKAEKTLFN